MKRKMGKNNDDTNLFRLLLPSVLGIILCLAFLCTGTFAWFSVSVSSASSELRGGNFAVSIDMKDSDAQMVTVAPQGTEISPGSYTVTLTSVGTAKGYCAVTVGNSVYVTPEIAPDGNISFTISVTDTTTVNFLACLGKVQQPNFPDNNELTDQTVTH